MTGTLKWMPAMKAEGSLSDELRRVLSKKYFDSDAWTGEVVIGGRDGMRDYLEGLRDVDVEDAGKLLSLLSKHGDIVLWVEY